MDSFFSTPAPFIVAAILGTIVWFFRDRNVRMKKETLLQEIKEKNIQAVYYDTKLTIKSRKGLSFQFSKENGELIFTENSILCFSHHSYFGYRFYIHIRHWHIGENPYQIPYAKPIQNIKIEKDNLVISTSERNINTTITFKSITNSEKIAFIKKLLHIPLTDNQDIYS